MLRSVFGRGLHARRRSIIGWSLGIAALTAMIIGFWPMVPEAPELEGLIDAMPEGMMAAFGMAEIDDLFSPAGYLDSQLLALMSPLVLLIFGIGAGAQAIAGDEDRGTLELLLAQPISRRRVLLERFAAVTMLLAGLVVVHWAVLAGGGVLVGLRPSAVGLAAIHVSLLLLTVLFAAVALAVGAATGRRGLAIGVSAAIGVLAYVVDSFAPLIDWLETVRPASPFYLYRGAQPLEDGLHAPHALALLVAIVVVVAVALVTFDRRDIGT